MPTPQVDPTDDEPTAGPATTAEEAMDRQTHEDGHVTESAYAPTKTGVDPDIEESRP